MATATNPPSSELEFIYVGGDPALDLVNTVDWTSRGPEIERLSDYSRLTRWAEGAGTLSAKDGAALRARAEDHPREAEAALSRALEAREVLRQLFHAIANEKPLGQVLNRFNQLLSQALQHMRVVPAAQRGGQPLQLGWDPLESKLESLIWPVIWSAGSLIASDEASRIRICGGPDCGWMYVDRSRNGLRRWCQMATCGTREKSRRRYQRVRSPSRARSRRQGTA